MLNYLINQLIPSVHAQASAIAGKGSAAVSESKGAVNELLYILWDKIDNWIAALVVTGVAFYIAGMVRSMVVNKIAEHIDEEHQDILVLAGRATYVTVVGLGLTIGLKIAGIDITAIVAAVGFGIGFAMKDLIMNFMAGVILLMTRNYTIGDFIKVNDTIGQIVEIQGRATIIKALDGTKVIVPNADLFSMQVISFTSNPFRRIEFTVGVEYSTNLPNAAQIIKNVLDANNDVIKEPAPAIVVDAFADSSINFIVRCWVDSKSNWVQIRSDVMMQMKAAFDLVGISIPFPIRTLVMDDKDENILAEQISQTMQSAQKEMKAEKLAAEKPQLTQIEAEKSGLSKVPAEAPKTVFEAQKIASAVPKVSDEAVAKSAKPVNIMPQPPDDSGKAFLENQQ